MYWKAGNTGFLISIKRILAVRALLNNQKKKIEQEKTSARRGGFQFARYFHEQPLESKVRSFVAASFAPLLAAAVSRSRA